MTRGNQRDEARLKNAKDAAGKGTKKEGSYLLRKEADSNALADKVNRLHLRCFTSPNLKISTYTLTTFDLDQVANKKAQEEAVARGETLPAAEKNGGGSIKKKDGSKK